MGLLSTLFGGVPSVTVSEAKQLVADGAVMVDRAGRPGQVR